MTTTTPTTTRPATQGIEYPKKGSIIVTEDDANPGCFGVAQMTDDAGNCRDLVFPTLTKADAEAQAGQLRGPGIKIGMRVQSGEGEDRDTGRVDAIDAKTQMATVSWDSLVVSTAPIALLRPA